MVLCAGLGNPFTRFGDFESEGEHVLPPRRVKPANHVFSDYCSYCFTGQCGTLGENLICLPAQTQSSRTPMATSVASDCQGRPHAIPPSQPQRFMSMYLNRW